MPSLAAPSPKNTTQIWPLPRSLDGQRRAGAEPDAGADDAVGAEDAALDIGDVHRAAEAAAVAGLAPEQLRHHAREVGALGDAVAVAAVMADDEVLVLERRAGADGNRLLADVGMRRALDRTVQEQLCNTLVEAAHAAKLIVEALQRRCVDGVGVHARSSDVPHYFRRMLERDRPAWKHCSFHAGRKSHSELKE